MRRLAALGAVLIAAVAKAHSVDVPKVDTVRLEPGLVTVTVDYVVPAVDAADLRKLYDMDHDGRLAPRERDGAIRWLALAATHFLQLRLDGASVDLIEDESVRAIDGLTDASGDVSAVFVLSAAIRTHGKHKLELRDRHKDPSILVPVKLHLVGGVRGDASEAVLGPERAVLAVGFTGP